MRNQISARGVARLAVAGVFSLCLVSCSRPPVLASFAMNHELLIMLPCTPKANPGGAQRLSIQCELVPNQRFTITIDSFGVRERNLFALYANYQLPPVDGLTLVKQIVATTGGYSTELWEAWDHADFFLTQALVANSQKAFVIAIERSGAHLSDSEAAAARDVIRKALDSIVIR
jgi:hypothetical protein